METDNTITYAELDKAIALAKHRVHIGDIVHYVLEHGAERPAIITAVSPNSECLNLQVFTECVEDLKHFGNTTAYDRDSIRIGLVFRADVMLNNENKPFT